MSLSNEELNLLYVLCKSGNEAASNYLLHHVYEFASDMARIKYYMLSPEDRKDVLQKAVVEFNFIISRYRFDKDASLKYFAALCIDNTLSRCYEKIKQTSQDFQLLSMDAPISFDDDFTLHSVLAGTKVEYNPEVSLHLGLLLDRMQRKILKQYSSEQRIKPIYIIYIMTIYGYSVDDIAATVGKSVHYVYRKRIVFRRFLRQMGIHTIDLK
ncbi:MAG: hypothetical protein J6P61_04845 [Erysipelotrichaceae bacterium]|nr:hypothetical protein [Erysipelotrichaceae bacterium]